ncbi:MAG: murein hydrolase activator EnvC family protein [Pseudonocardiaceae bacterium]
MFRVLICAMLVTVLSGGAGAGMVAPTGLAVQPGPEDAGDQPQLRTGMFGWPLPGTPAVVRGFQAPTSPFGPGHRGVDLATVAGAPVFAAGTGTVVFAGAVAGRGVVSVDHPGGLRTTYEPVSPTVTAGDRVARGEQLGTVQLGHPGCTATACLHWGVRRGSGHDREYLDPLRLVVNARVRLLPIDGPPPGGFSRPGESAGGGVEHLAP